MKLIKTPSRNTMLIRSVVNIIFGLLILTFPALTLWILAIAFSINLLIVGLFMIFEPTIDESNSHAIITAIIGLLSVGAGIYMLIRPLASIAIITILFVVWAVLFGIVDLSLGLKLTEMKKSQSWLFYIAGALSIVFAIFILLNPIEGGLAVVWAIGAYSLAVGLITGYNALINTGSKGKNKKKPARKKGKK